MFRQVSLGRRWYRELEYTSNSKLCIATMHPSTLERKTTWPSWGRFEVIRLIILKSYILYYLFYLRSLLVTAVVEHLCTSLSLYVSRSAIDHNLSFC